ncbi:hypothetical protein LX97_00651 [Nonlabens dokdonensis]|uniref:Lipoprotein n=2 Tax=Nonlabens dokdonensis TaxID=328515 RepID=L7WAQ0_NONDD|nr:hypothetical protein DDD_0846 [Nonlabens dokdonensis DSW-6]PZX43650.1 hypothetical protein LX97_00651 [Nonlabens dokdonensis]
MRYHKIAKITLLILIGFVSSCSNNSKKSPLDELWKYQDYIKDSEKITSQLDSLALSQRNLAIEKLKQNNTYIQIVDSLQTNPEYLVILNAINDGVRSSYVNQEGKEMFSIDESLLAKVERLPNADDKIEFIINVTLLTLPNKGGLTQPILSSLNRYQKRFNYYGLPQTFYNTKGEKKWSIDYPYDLSAIFNILDPNNKKAINALYEAKSKGISNWFTANDKKFINPRLATVEGYIKFLKSNHKRSDHLPDNYDSEFWENYDEEVNIRIIKMILFKDCKGLQKEFDIADKNSESQRIRTGSGNVQLMNFINSQMIKMDCF